ncbi:MAG: hypothetical protein CMJ13_02245 [Pelagibacterales bacterium]|nr:hypothetical protein [Pelagibacterales bacterium]
MLILPEKTLKILNISRFIYKRLFLEYNLSDSNISAILANLGSRLAIPKVNESISRLITGKITAGGQEAGKQSIANTLKARSDSWRAAANNARQAIDALLVAEASLNEIASLAQRLEELGALYNNNTLLSTTDIAALNAETATISTNINSIVTGTTFNGISMLGATKINFTAGVTDDGGTISLTTGTVSSISSLTEASNADTSGAAMTAEVALNLGEIAGGIQSLRARENIAYAASAIMSAAADSIVETDYAAETAILTKNMMLNKISLSLVAQANVNENFKVNLLS